MQLDVTDYRDFAARLRAAESPVRNALRRRIRSAAKPVGDHTVLHGADSMPARGGLQAQLRQARVGVSITGTSLAINLRPRGGGGGQLKTINETGRLRHPVFGNRRTVVTQNVPARSYDAAFEAGVKEFADELERVLDDVMGELS